MQGPIVGGRTRGSRLLLAAMVGLLAAGVTAAPTARVAEAQTPELSWIVWAPPSSYPVSVTAPLAYTYASSAEGVLTLPDTTTVYVTLTGEIVNPAVGTAASNCIDYCGPSGFTANNTTRSNYWQTYPYSNNGASFTSTNVPFAELPPNGDHIGLIGVAPADGGNPTQTLEFFSDSARTQPVEVANIVMLIGSMGNLAVEAIWNFTQDVVVLNDNQGVPINSSAGSGLTRTGPSTPGAGYDISGREGTGSIQFVGSFSSLSWTVSAPESWASWNIAATNIPVQSPDAEETPAAAAPGPTLDLDCTPDPVVAGGTVSCEVTAGDAGIDILWRASLDAMFAERGVTLGADGAATFSFLAPPTASGRTIVVELVAWGVSDTVAVIGGPVPTDVPAGAGPPARGADALALPLMLMLLATIAGLGLTATRPIDPGGRRRG